MEYTVGSVADLVSGKNTPNKPKVIKRKLPQPKVDTQQAPQIETSLPKVKKADNYGEPSFNRGKKAPFKKGNKPLFNKKNKKVKNYAEEPSFNRGNAAPSSKGNKSLFNKKNKIKNYTEEPRFNTGNAAPFKKGNKPLFNKKNKKYPKTATNETDVTVIDHKLIEKLEKPDLKNPDDGDDGADNNSEGDDDSAQSDTNEDVDNEEVPQWQSPAVKKEHDSRTIFVGNIGTAVTKRQLLKFFSKFGKVEAVRLRCATPSNPGVSKRVAVIKKMFHPKRATMHSYIRFEKREDALKAVELNGATYKDHHLRVQMSDDAEKPDASKAIFVGNLPFDVEDDDLWTAFESLGTIKSVRVIRNSATGMGIGIGYVNFDSSDFVEFALQMEDVIIKNKVLRIQRYSEKSKKTRKVRRHERRKHTDKSDGPENPKPKYKGTKEPSNKPAYGKSKLKSSGPKGISKNAEDPEKPKRPKNKFMDSKAPSINIKNSVFQGSKSDKKKQKPKVNRGFIQKLKLSQKIAPRTTL